MKYKYQYMSLTDIGQLFYKNPQSPVCASSHDVGRWLIAIGLRDGDKLPSQRALDNGFAIQKYSGPKGDIPNYYWETIKTVAELEKAGYQRLPNPPGNLVQHDKMDGPYTHMPNSLNGYDLIDTKGDIIATIYEQQNAKIVSKALNAYDRCLKKKANEGGTP